MNASLCPVAIFHELIHGQDNALTGSYVIGKRGDLFDGFISHLKYSLMKESLSLKGDGPFMKGQVRTLFEKYAHLQGFQVNATVDLWKAYINPWVERKLDNNELQEISKTNQRFFEISLANPKIPFPLDEGYRNYPLSGRVDEIDITNKRIIERTIKGNEDSETPPRLKDYQVWLYKQILCSLSESQRPPH